MRLPSLPRLVLYALVVTLCGAIIIAASTSGAAFGAYNPAWDGTSDMRALADTHSESTLTLDVQPYETTEANDTLAVILAPAEPYTTAELTTLRDFVTNGGTLLVADNFGTTTNSPPYGNTVLDAVGASARFDGALLRDEQNYFRAPTLPIASNVSTHPYTDGVSTLTLNYATAVDPGTADPIVTTSSVAYLDRNQSGSLDGTETVGHYPVVTVETVGNGSVVSIGDPSLFINSMLEQEDNAAFATALFAAHDRVLIDYSAGGGTPPLAVVGLLIQSTPLLQGLVAGLSVLGVWGISQYPTIPAQLAHRVRRWLLAKTPGTTAADTSVTASATPGPSQHDLVAYLQNEHPDWEEARLQQIVASINRETEPDTTDE